MKRTLIATLAALFVASGVSAATLTVDTDKSTYLIGETITVTATLDLLNTDPASQIVDLTMNWDPAVAFALNATGTFTNGTSSQIVTAGPNAGGSAITSFGGGLFWTGPATTGCVLLGSGAGNTCQILNQANLSGAFAPDTQTLVGTLELEASGLGAVGLNTTIVEAFGASADLGANLQTATVVVPEPTTAALLGLGLLGLGVAGRRR